MAAPIKMDELLVSWLGSDEVYENVLELIDKYRLSRKATPATATATATAQDSSLALLSGSSEHESSAVITTNTSSNSNNTTITGGEDPSLNSTSSPRSTIIPPFYPLKTAQGRLFPRRRQLPRQSETWDPIPDSTTATTSSTTTSPTATTTTNENPLEDPTQALLCVQDQLIQLLPELDISLPPNWSSSSPPSKEVLQEVLLPLESFVRITKEICNFPTFFAAPLYQRILDLWLASPDGKNNDESTTMVTFPILEWYWRTEMEPYDAPERFFRLVKQPENDCILRDDFLPYMKAMLQDHPVSTAYTVDIRYRYCRRLVYSDTLYPLSHSL